MSACGLLRLGAFGNGAARSLAAGLVLALVAVAIPVPVLAALEEAVEHQTAHGGVHLCEKLECSADCLEGGGATVHRHEGGLGHPRHDQRIRHGQYRCGVDQHHVELLGQGLGDRSCLVAGE